ncbi:MAG: hypothetical protein EWM73_00439 [Nitrospira sp.]|nr:MAG: hypothetical protein EWM73_00439 [Nitrospira sp.]
MLYRFPFPIRLDFSAASQPRYPFRFPVPLPEEKRSTASANRQTEFAINEGDRCWCHSGHADSSISLQE